MRRFLPRIFILTLALGLAASAAIQKLPAYQPRPVAPPKDAPYVLADGSIYLAGSDGMAELLTKFNALFIKTHPDFKFKLLIKGSAATALGGLSSGVSAFALTAREAWPLELRPFRQLYGYGPAEIRIGRNGYCAPGRTCPPGIYVNAKN